MSWELSRRFDTDDGQVAWDRFGQGPALVLTHGTPFSSAVWRHVVPALARYRTVYVWDLLGYGFSAQAEGQNVSIARQGRLLAQLLTYWGIEGAHLAGHDFGGAITLRAHLLEKSSARALTLIDAVSCGTWGTGWFHLAREYADVFRRLPAYAHEALLERHIATASHRELPSDAVQTYLASWCGKDGQAAYYRMVEQSRQEDTEEFQHLLETLTVPVTVLWGREDRWMPSAFADLLRSRLPQASFHWIEEAGHLVPEDAPALLASYLLDT